MITKRKNYIYDNCYCVRLSDADTIHVLITEANDIGFEVQQITTMPQEFRIMEYDAPEIFHPRNAAEKAHGMAALKRATELLLEKKFTIQSFKGDKYGRYLGKITLPDGRDFVDVMKSEGFQKRDDY